jgi:hypothetical protein
MTQRTSRPYQNLTKYVSRNFKLYADVSALRDLLTDGGVNYGTWRILVQGAGTLVVRPVNGSVTPADASRDVNLGTVAAGTKLEIECIALVSGTATNILVMW